MSLRADGEGSPEGTSAPGQVASPGAWPGAVTEPLGWQAGEDTDDIVTGPLPALQKLAGRFGSGLSTTEWLAFLRATVNRGQPLAEADLHRLLDYAEGHANRDDLILAALEIFHDGMAKAIVGDGGQP